MCQSLCRPSAKKDVGDMCNGLCRPSAEKNKQESSADPPPKSRRYVVARADHPPKRTPKRTSRRACADHPPIVGET